MKYLFCRHNNNYYNKQNKLGEIHSSDILNFYTLCPYEKECCT